MALHEIIKRYKEIDYLIASADTGNPEQLSKKLGISKRQLFNYLNAINKIGMKTEFDPDRQSYVYLKKSTH